MASNPKYALHQEAQHPSGCMSHDTTSITFGFENLGQAFLLLLSCLNLLRNTEVCLPTECTTLRRGSCPRRC